MSERDARDPADAPVTAREAAEAEALREALEDPTRAGDDAELARALRAAWEPGPLDEQRHAALVQAALARPRRGRVVRVSFGAAAVLALAASVAVVLRGDRQPMSPTPTLAVSRSTQELFPARFADLGGETGRVDRIAMARAADLRDNEFARWGVR